MNYIVHMENRVIDVLRKLKNKKIISKNRYEDLYPVGLNRAFLYGRAKT